MPICETCQTQRALVKRPKTGTALCPPCFFQAFEDEVHDTIQTEKMFLPGDRIAIGASGGKDSTVLAYVLNLLNKRHQYGLELFLLSIDEGIKGYRDDSLRTVNQNHIDYALPLTILSYQDLYGWTMDAIVSKIGRKNNCTFCGVFRRQALDRGAKLLKCRYIATGHNADDIAETVLLNMLRGDHARLARCTQAITHDADADNTEGCTDSSSNTSTFAVMRCKPFKFTYEKEIVMYAYFRKLTYFSTECPYSPDAYRGHVRDLLKRLESLHSATIIDIIKSGDSIHDTMLSKKGNSNSNTCTLSAMARSCIKCGYITSNEMCKACLLLEGLNTNQPMLGINGRRRTTLNK